VLIVDESGATLLLRGADPAATAGETWWFTPGGGVEGSESLYETAVREVCEETGVLLSELHGPIYSRDVAFSFEGEPFEQHEEFLYTRVQRFAVSNSSWTALERRTLIEWRWWSIDQLESTSETLHPDVLASLVRQVIDAK